MVIFVRYKTKGEDMAKKIVKTECSCDNCQQRCKNAPGWFKPDEPEGVAKFLGIGIRELFTKYLSVDFWMSDHEIGRDVFIL